MWQELDQMRFPFRVRSITDTLQAAWSDPGEPDQVCIGAPGPCEIGWTSK